MSNLERRGFLATAGMTMVAAKLGMPTDQTSGHAVVGFAARAALVEVFGDAPGEPMTMTSTTAVPAGSTRSWATFSHAAAENADSRVMVGIHTRQSVLDGEKQGRLVGDYVVRHRLRPLDD